jgi:hypothetical protein
MGVLLVTIRENLRARRRWLRVRPEYGHLATGMALAVIAYMFSGITLHLSYERYFWFLLALAGSTAWLLRGGRLLGELATDDSPADAVVAAAGRGLKPSPAAH